MDMTFRVESPVMLRRMPNRRGLCHYPCPEAEEVQKEMQGVVRKYVSFNFTDPFQGGIHVEDEQEERVRALYDIMHKELYEFFRSELMEKLLPRCSCGANTYCRCE